MPFSFKLNVIQVTGTGIEVRVYELDTEDFITRKHGLYLYGYHNDDYFAFEITGWTRRQLHLVTEAIEWYAAYFDKAGMQITLEDPRPRYLRIVG